MHVNGIPVPPDGSGEHVTGIMDVPKDRTQLANMRVIRRNLVYAVGLPPSISNEDQLRKADYFGQYGKMSKIVLNRNQASNGDPRRASCSAYVTFVHKEDTLACILSVDGFYLENRNIRASYGTSKYCSAFIKNVRCNNPECTYLHEMGAVEDTFTKQEIQAGYVTSGRDVLARQQQIVEQALASSQGASGTVPRRRIGGGGPSGTGRAASNAVFPVPEFDEPARAAPLIPAPTGMSRAASTNANFPTVAAAAAQQQAAALAAKPLSRAASTGANTRPPKIGGAFPAMPRKEPVAAPAPPVSAASVVAGVHSVSGGLSAPSRGTTLTPLTPLKRASKPSSKASTAPSDTLGMPTINNSYPKPSKVSVQRKKSGGARGAIAAAIAPAPPVSPPSPVSLPNAGSNNSNNSARAPLNGAVAEQQKKSGLSSLGGEVIAAPVVKAPVAVGAIGSAFGGPHQRGPAPVGSGALNGLGSSGGGDILGGRPIGLSGLGGDVFTGPLTTGNIGPRSAIGSGVDKWGSNPNNQFSGSGALNSGPGQPIGPSGGLWGGPGGGGSNLPGVGGQIGGGVIGGSQMSHGSPFGAPGPGGGSGSSALANILGINLPTGSGSLRETSNLWPPGQQPQQPTPLSFLNGSPMPMPQQGVIGRSNGGSSGLIGGVPIGGNHGVGNQPGAIGSSNKNDIALLQSLLPEVHITSGNGVAQNNGGWNPGPGGQQQQQPVGVGAVGRNNNMSQQQGQPQGSAGNLNIW